jgi:hypothetical protein
VIALYFVLATILVGAAAVSLRRSRFPIYGRAFAVLVLVYGLLVKPIFVALGLPSEEFIAQFILAPLSDAEYWIGSVWLLAGYAIFVGAMMATAHVLKTSRRPAPPTRGPTFAVGRGWLLLVIGVAGLVAFFAQNVELLFGASKNILAAGDLADYGSSGGLRLLISLLYLIPFLMIVNIGAGRQVSASLRLMWIAALLWIAFGFFSDQRGAILFSVISWLIAYRGFVGKIRRETLGSAAAIAVTMVLLRSLLRLTGDAAGQLAVADELLGNYIGRNLVENAKTLIIIKSIPEHLSYAFGGSYLDSILILVPRSLFPDKTTVNLDTVIGMAVFGCEAFGACAVPPGLIAESYLNFGIVGLPFLMALGGWLTAWLDWKSAGRSVAFRVLYAGTLVYFGISALGSGISSFATQSIMDGGIFLVAYLALRSTTPRGRLTVEPTTTVAR